MASVRGRPSARTSSSSTSCCPSSTATRSPRRSAPKRRPGTCRSSCSPPSARSSRRSAACAPAPTTTSSSRSIPPSCSPASRACSCGSVRATSSSANPPLGKVLAFYGAKGGVGTTTIAINSAIALHRELGRRVVLVDGNLQFGDHRVFLDLGLDRKSVVDVGQRIRRSTSTSSSTSWSATTRASTCCSRRRRPRRRSS